jgi:DNA polymerase III subunit delta'
VFDIIGQKRTVSLLEHGLNNGYLSHAYLFTGPEHIGKMALALELAMALNCTGKAPPCHECPSCKKIAAGNHADVQVIRLAPAGDDEADTTSEAMRISIEQVKEVQHSANLPPFEGKHRVYIIEGAEQLSMEAANRLLKTLEEPPEHVTFILLTVNAKLLLPTVISRCQRIEFPRVPPDEEAAALAEELHLEPERAHLLAVLSRGCPGWAINAAADDAILERRNINLDGVVNTIKAEPDERFTYVAKLAEGFSRNRKAVYDILDVWQDYWRDMLLAKTGCPQLIVNFDRKDEIIKIAEGFTLGGIKNAIARIRGAGTQLKQNVNPRLALEVLMLDLPRAETLNTKL